jgi:hypothetical protein
MDFVIGYPSRNNADGQRFPCGTLDKTCFGLYFYEEGALEQPGNRFVYEIGAYRNFKAGLLQSIGTKARDRNPTPSQTRPDLEWTIDDFNFVRTEAGYPAIDLNAVIPWEFNMVGFAGSFQDDGVGEDFVPNDAPVSRQTVLYVSSIVVDDVCLFYWCSL